MGLENLARIRAIVSDVDGVLTGGEIVVTESGENKTFNVRDGLGMSLFLKAGFQFALLSGRESKAVRLRAQELGLGAVKVGRLDKETAFAEILSELNLEAGQVAYIGDDLPDLAPIRLAGIGFCPANAGDEVRAAADYVIPVEGGRGVVRHVVEMILKSQNLWERCVAAFEPRGIVSAES